MPEALPPANPLAVLMMLGLMASVVGAWIWAILRLALDAAVLPRFEPRVVPWGGKSVLAVLAAWVAVQVGGFRVYLLATRGTIGRPGGARAQLDPSDLMTASALQNGAVLVAIPLLLRLTCGARPWDFVGAGPRWAWRIFQGVVAWPLAAPVVYGMMVAAVAIWGRESHPLETAIQRDGVGGKAVILFLAGVVLAPAAEELIFRGVILGWLTRLVLAPVAGEPAPADPLDEPGSPPLAAAAAFGAGDDPAIAAAAAADDSLPEPAGPGGPSPGPDGSAAPTRPALAPAPDWRDAPGLATRLAMANVAVSILFATLHYTVWPTPVPIFFLSLVLGGLYQRTGSLVAPVALHMTFNGVSTVLMFLMLGATPHQPAPTDPPQAPIPAPVPRPVDPITAPAPAPAARPAGAVRPVGAEKTVG